MKDSIRRAIFAQKTLNGKRITIRKGNGKDAHKDFFIIDGDGSPRSVIDKGLAVTIFLAKIDSQNKRHLRLKGFLK